MKEKELFVDYKPQQLIYYVEKDDASYGPLLSGSYLSKNYLDDYFEKKEKLEKSLREQLNKGEISPVYYYMLMQEMGEGDLASRAQVSKRKLKMHFRMENFQKLRLAQLKKYADAFDVPVAAMFHLMITRLEDQGKIAVKQIQTKNSYFSISHIGIETK
ncbi:MAG: hypothetical protein R2764_21785 [Bacteroidales bacterium]